MDARTEEIRARVEKATPGPWSAYCETSERDNFAASVYGEGHKGLLIARASQNQAHGHDAWFIAHARSDIPYLLTELTALREEIERLKGALEIAFVQGAQWWEWERTSFTMWGADRNRAEAEAAKLNAAGTLGMTYEDRMKRAAALSPSPAQQEQK